MKVTLILGASAKPNRYSNMAHTLLKKHGHQVIPVHPNEQVILEDDVYNELKDVWEVVDTLCVYVKPSQVATLVDEIIRVAPQRIVFNPGTESPELYHEFPVHVEILEDCTLQMLNTGRF